MAITGRRVKIKLAGIVAASALLGGCSDGVEMNGRLLDAVGMSTAALSAKKPEPKLAPRAPLVMPPSNERLPEPGSAPPPAPLAADGSWPKDKDHEKVASAADRQRQHDQYCRDGNWKERAVDDAAHRQGPLGACGSIFSWTQDLFGAGPADDKPSQ